MMSGWIKNRPRYTRQALLSALVAFAVCIHGAALAQEIDDGSKARVNLASKLGMLSQKISGAACRITSGIEATDARLALSDARVEVQSILEGLEFGNRVLGVPTPERQSRTIRALRLFGDEWNRMSAAVDGILSGADIASNASRIVTATGAMNDKADVLASEIQARYSNPNEMLVVDALAIQMAGRQRILIEKAAAEACLLSLGIGDAAVLRETTDLFERTLAALRDGMPAAGIRKPPNEQVLKKIDIAWDSWRASQVALDAAVEGNVDPGSVAQITTAADRLVKDMNDLVILYILSTPGRDGAIRALLAEIAETELKVWTKDPALVAAVKAQNQAHSGIAQDRIDALDMQWRAEAKAEGGPLVNDLMSRAVSITLRDKQVATAGFINEIFVMDHVGLNVAQSAVTSDYWQGDEGKFQKSYGDGTGTGNVHISEVEFDESTGVFQSQVSIPVTDLETGQLLGAMTFGVNVQSLM